MLSAGRLRHRLTLQAPVETQNQNTGDIVTSWQDAGEVWGAIEPVSAREYITAQAEQSKITVRIVLRYNSTVTAKMRLYHAAKDAYYNIEGILSDKDSGQEYMTLPCSEGVRY